MLHLGVNRYHDLKTIQKYPDGSLKGDGSKQNLVKDLIQTFT